MGREKARLKFRGHTLLGHARALVDEVGLPCRVIRHDAVPCCGPLGGIITALRTTKLSRVLFLPCDMPFVTSKLARGHLAAGQMVGTGYPDSRNCLFRELNRGVKWLFSNNALELAEIWEQALQEIDG